MNLETLRARAAKDELEVEDILEAAAKRVPGLDCVLENLIDECGWTDGGPLSSGAIEIPFRRWAITAIHFSRGDIPALLSLARDRSYIPFVLALLQQLHTGESAHTVVNVAPEIFADPIRDPETALRIARSLNLILSLPPQVILAPRTSEQVCHFLHTLIPLCKTDGQLATAVLGLRGVGGQQSLDLIRSLPPLSPPWSDATDLAIKAIRRRLRKP